MKRRYASRIVTGLFIVLSLLAISGQQSAMAGETQSLYRLGGNHFILRERDSGGQRSVTVYRQAGDQWERFAGSTAPSGGTYGGLAGRIVTDGQYLGPSSIDLDDWMNTDLNRSGPDRID